MPGSLLTWVNFNLFNPITAEGGEFSPLTFSTLIYDYFGLETKQKFVYPLIRVLFVEPNAKRIRQIGQLEAS